MKMSFCICSVIHPVACAQSEAETRRGFVVAQTPATHSHTLDSTRVAALAAMSRFPVSSCFGTVTDNGQLCPDQLLLVDERVCLNVLFSSSQVVQREMGVRMGADDSQASHMACLCGSSACLLSLSLCLVQQWDMRATQQRLNQIAVWVMWLVKSSWGLAVL